MGQTGRTSQCSTLFHFLCDILHPHPIGFNDVSWHNSDILTPNLEELARSGLLLENAYMQPMCTPSRAALLTGYYPIHTGRQVCACTLSMSSKGQAVLDARPSFSKNKGQDLATSQAQDNTGQKNQCISRDTLFQTAQRRDKLC